jgi:hypothetical protein
MKEMFKKGKSIEISKNQTSDTMKLHRIFLLHIYIFCLLSLKQGNKHLKRQQKSFFDILYLL